MILQVVRERVLAGREDEYRAIESETARACAELGCPHPHLALETVEGPLEVWWLNLFESDGHREDVTRAYEANVELMRVLRLNSRRKARTTASPIDIVAGYRADISPHRPLVLTAVRFLAVAIAGHSALAGGTVFDADDGTRLVLVPARSEVEIRAMAEEAGGGITLLKVQPRWGVPASDWAAADLAFWTVNPSVSR